MGERFAHVATDATHEAAARAMFVAHFADDDSRTVAAFGRLRWSTVGQAYRQRMTQLVAAGYTADQIFKPGGGLMLLQPVQPGDHV